MAKRQPEDQTLAQIDNALAGLSAVFPAVAVIVARQRANLTPRDMRELETIMDAASRAKDALRLARGWWTE